MALSCLLGTTLAVELWADWSWHHMRPFMWLYNVYVIIHYALLCWYFSKAYNGNGHRYILWTIPVFTVISIVISVNLYGFTDFPGQNINIEGILISVMCAGVLFNLDSRLYPNILQQPDFWICCGLLVFFAGTFISNGLFPYLLALDREEAIRLFATINKPLNLILYSCLIAGFICAMPRRSYTR